MKTITIVVPCYNEEEALPIFYQEIKKIASNMNIRFEYLFINDGSKDKTLEVIREISKKDQDVRYISFSRNFGKEAAMFAGLKESTGDYVTIMDADLQDPPSLLPEMIFAIENEGYDCVASRSVSRNGYGFVRKLFTKIFYKIIQMLCKVEMVAGARDFRLMTRQMTNSVIEMGEYNRYSKGIFGFVGYNTKWIEFVNQERVAGTTKWNFWKLFVYGIDGIISFSTVPLIISAFLGLFFFFIAIIMIIFIIVKTVIYGDPTSGWPSLACIIFFVSGVQLFCTGLIGYYLAPTYLETKKRPIYIVKETEKDKK